MVKLSAHPEWVGIVFRNPDGTYTAIELDNPYWNMSLSGSGGRLTDVHIEIAGQAQDWSDGQPRTRNPRYQVTRGRPMVEGPEDVVVPEWYP